MKLAVVELTYAAIVEAVMVGGVVSIVHVREVAVPTLPAWSVARIWTVCEPSASAVYACGLVHATQPALSRLH